MKIEKIGLSKTQPLTSSGKQTAMKEERIQPDVSLVISEMAKKISSMSDGEVADSAKVGQIRALVQNGEYKINPERIARVLLGLEVEGR